jgi:hypothetical protein
VCVQYDERQPIATARGYFRSLDFVNGGFYLARVETLRIPLGHRLWVGLKKTPAKRRLTLVASNELNLHWRPVPLTPAALEFMAIERKKSARDGV